MSDKELQEALDLERKNVARVTLQYETERNKNYELIKTVQEMELSRQLLRESVAGMVMRFKVLYPYGDEITKSTVVRDVQVDLEEILRNLESS